MKIAIDIDNTLLRCRSLVYKIMSLVEKNFLLKVTKNPVVCKKGEARRFANKHRNVLFGKLGNIKMYEEIDGAIDVINKLAENGHSIVFLSNRPNIRFLNNVIMTWLEQNKVQYDFVVINCGDKVGFCKKYGVDLLIDDSVKNCKDAKNAGIETILFGGKPNKKDYYVQSNEKSSMFGDCDFEIDKPANNLNGYADYKKYKDSTLNSNFYANTWNDVSEILEKKSCFTILDNEKAN